MRESAQPVETACDRHFLDGRGEEQGLYGSDHFARMARAENWNIEAVLNDDIVGGNKSPEQDPGVVRVFSEGLPNTSGERQLERLRALGGENDSPSRELARYVAETASGYGTGVKPLLIFRLDRYLRGGDHSSFNAQGYPAVRFTEYRKTFRDSTRMCGRRTVLNSAICRSSWTSTTWRESHA